MAAAFVAQAALSQQQKAVDAALHRIQVELDRKQTADALRGAAALSAQSPRDAEVHLKLGMMLAAATVLKPARAELEKAESLMPGRFEIEFSLGQVLLLSAEPAKAEAALQRALKAKPDSAETMYLLAEAMDKQARPLDALDLLVKARRLAPQNADVLLLMAQISMEQHYYEDAIPLLQQATQLAPQRVEASATLAEAYFFAGQVEQAIPLLNAVIKTKPTARNDALLGVSYLHLGRYDEAAQAFENGLKLEPGNAYCRFNLGLIAERKGDAAKAEAIFQELLRAHPEDANALPELAGMYLEDGKPAEAERLLKRYAQLGRASAKDYYKLAMAERELHETAAAERDLREFQRLSKQEEAGAHPYENLFDYLDNRAKLAPQARAQAEIGELVEEAGKHPEQPAVLYALAEAYLRAGKVEDAKGTLAQLEKLDPGDVSTLTGAGVLLARHRLYDDAVDCFEAALRAEKDAADPRLDAIEFDLANALYRKGLYGRALDAAERVTERGRKDDGYLALLADIDAHLGETARAEQIFRDAIARNPDNDQWPLSLALLELKQGGIAAAQETLVKARQRMPASGKLAWGLALCAAMKGETSEAARQFERALALLPEWPGSYSALGVFYFETGQIAKAREVLDRFKNSSAGGVLDIDRIQQVLARANENPALANAPMNAAQKGRLLQLALTLAEKTL